MHGEVKKYNIRGFLNYEGLWYKQNGLKKLFFSVTWIGMKVNWCRKYQLRGGGCARGITKSGE